jgi:hypothetical protein
VLWKAHVYASENERRTLEAEALSFGDVVRIFSADLSARNSELRLDLDALDDPQQSARFAAIYPEARPVEAGPSIFDAYA